MEQVLVNPSAGPAFLGGQQNQLRGRRVVDSGGHGKAVDLGDQARREGPRRHANAAHGAGVRRLR